MDPFFILDKWSNLYMNIKEITEKMRPIEENIKLSNIEGVSSAYTVGINLLKFNPYNDRFAMERAKYEMETGTKLGFDDVSQEWVFKHLTSTDKSRNEITKDDIRNNGILKPIVADINGVVLDGNRRISILKNLLSPNNSKNLSQKEIESFEKLKIVIIEKELTEKQIHDYETTLQISEDEKVDYKPINIYLKIKRLYEDSEVVNEKMKIREVSNKMGAKYSETEIKQKLGVIKVMESFLIFVDKPKQYSYLDKKEDHFKQIYSFEKAAKNNSIKYDDLKNDIKTKRRIKNILFSLTSLQYEGKKFREVVPGSKKIDKTPLQSIKGLEFVEEEIEKFSELVKVPSQNSNDQRDLEIKDIFKKAELIIKVNDPTFGIKNDVNNINKSSSKINKWANSLIGTHSYPKEIVDKLNDTIKKLELTVKKLKAFDD